MTDPFVPPAPIDDEARKMVDRAVAFLERTIDGGTIDSGTRELIVFAMNSAREEGVEADDFAEYVLEDKRYNGRYFGLVLNEWHMCLIGPLLNIPHRWGLRREGVLVWTTGKLHGPWEFSSDGLHTILVTYHDMGLPKYEDLEGEDVLELVIRNCLTEPLSKPPRAIEQANPEKAHHRRRFGPSKIHHASEPT